MWRKIRRKCALQTAAFSAFGCLLCSAAWKCLRESSWSDLMQQSCSWGKNYPFSLFLCFLFTMVVTDFWSFHQQTNITQNRVLLKKIKQQLIYKGLSTDSVLVDVIFVAYIISFHDNKGRCFGICVTPFKSTTSSAHFMFITFIHSCSRGSK